MNEGRKNKRKSKSVQRKNFISDKKISRKSTNEKSKVKNIEKKPKKNKVTTVKTNKAQLTKKMGEKPKNRRRAPKNNTIRKARICFFYVGIFLSVICLGAYLSLTVLFKIDSIEVEGLTKYENSAIIELSGVQKRDNLLLANTKKGEQSIKDSFPYIKSVNIIKKVPGRIVIKVEEALPSGVIEADGRYILLSDDLRVLEVSDVQLDGFSTIKGSGVKEANAGEYVTFCSEGFNYVFHDFVNILSKYEIEPVTEFDFTNLSSIVIVYDNRVKIKFGSDDNLEYKMQTAKHIIKEKLSATEKGVLDLTVVSEDGHSYFMPEYNI